MSMNSTSDTKTNVYPVRQEEEMEKSESTWVEINNSKRYTDDDNIQNDEELDNIDEEYLIEDFLTPCLSKFVKICVGVHSFGKNGKVDVVKYYVFWILGNLFISNQFALWMYLAGAEVTVCYIISLLYIPMIMIGVQTEIHVITSSYTAALLSRPKIRKELKSNFMSMAGVIGFFWIGIFWAVPTFAIILPYLQNSNESLPIGLKISFYAFIYAYPIFMLLMMLNFSWIGIIELHQKEIIARIKKVTTEMLHILKDEKLNGMEGRRKLSQIYTKSIKQIHVELKQQGLGMTVMITFPIWIVVVVFYITFGPMDPIRSETTAGSVFRILFYLMFISQFLVLFLVGFKQIVAPNNIWHQFTDAILKDPHLLYLAAGKFDNKLEFLNLWLEKNIITFRLFGISIDRTLPGKVFAGLTSVIVSAGFVVGRMTGTF